MQSQTPRRKSASALAPQLSLSSYLQRTAKIPLFVAIAAVFFLAVFIYSEDIAALAEVSLWRLRQDFVYVRAPRHKPRPRPPPDAPVSLPPPSCDLSSGRWLPDNRSFPLYYEEDCRFLTDQVSCSRNGRRDETYQQWSWHPLHCSLPRYPRRSSLLLFPAFASTASLKIPLLLRISDLEDSTVYTAIITIRGGLFCKIHFFLVSCRTPLKDSFLILN